MPAVKALVDFAQMRVGDVSVDLRRGDVAMPEHTLDTPEVGAIHQQVGCKTMAHSVRRDMFSDAGYPGVFVDNALDGARCQPHVLAACIGGRRTGVADKERYMAIESGLEIRRQPLAGFRADKNRSVFLAFAAHGKLAAREIDVVAVEIGQLADTQTRAEKQLHDRTIAQARRLLRIDGLNKPHDLLASEKRNLFAPDFR